MKQGVRYGVRGGLLWVYLTVLLVCMLAAAAAGCGNGATDTTSGGETSGEPIVIGAIVSATGANAALGVQERNILETMQERINADGGVLGRQIRIVIEDDKSDPQEAVTATNRLLEQEKAVALIAATGSSSTVAVKAITADKGIPQMAMVAGNVITDEPPIDWIWRTHRRTLSPPRAR